MKKTLIIITLAVFCASLCEAQIKSDIERKKQQEIQQRQSIKAEAERQQRLQAEREEAVRKAEQERLKREERKRLGIPDVTKDDLTRNTTRLNMEYFSDMPESWRDEYSLPNGKFFIKSPNSGSHYRYDAPEIDKILLLDVYGSYGLRYDNFDNYAAGYKTELQRKIFENSDDYFNKLDALKTLRKEMLQTVFFVPYKRLDNYDLQAHGFHIGTGDYSYSSLKGPIVFDVPTANMIMNVDEKTAAEIEGNEDVYVYLFFQLNGKIERNDYMTYSKYADKLRVVVANKKTGKIYWDASSPYGCLPLAKQETMTTQAYLAYKAEQDSQLAEQKNEQRRLEQEKMQEARDKEKAKIEAEKQKAKEKYDAYIAIAYEKLGTSFTFDSESDYSGGKLQGRSGSKFQGKPIFIDDTPNGKGKSVLMDPKTSLYIKDWNTHTAKIPITLSVWIKIPNNNNNQQYFGDEYYRSKLANKFLPVSNDSQWHWLYIVSDLKNASVGDANGYSMVDGGTCAFYVDGKLIKNILLPKRKVNKGHNSDMDFSIGNKNGSMIIDNLRLGYNVLTDKEIATIYEEEKSVQSENIQL